VQFQYFRGSDVREALQRVRAELGPEAVIGGTRQIRGTGAMGSSYVEIEAAAPESQGPFAAGMERNPTPAARRPPNYAERPHKASVSTEMPAVTSSSVSPAARQAVSELESEIATLRLAVEQLQAASSPKNRALGALNACGIEGTLAAHLAAGAPRSVKKDSTRAAWLKQRIRERMTVTSGIIERPGRQVIAAVGPTGAGKTTTLAKLAARARLDLGRTVGVISLDVFRVGAAEQWQRYARLIGLNFHLARDGADFARALGSLETDLVLVDTAGISPGMGSHQPLIDGLERTGHNDAHVLLVVPAWLRGNDVEAVVDTYRSPAPTSIVATKLDEARRVGGLLHASLPTRTPFSYFCAGPRVPEDLNDASPEGLLGRLLPDEMQ
jgi:flagellar biosynthesis protein FlhF